MSGPQPQASSPKVATVLPPDPKYNGTAVATNTIYKKHDTKHYADSPSGTSATTVVMPPSDTVRLTAVVLVNAILPVATSVVISAVLNAPDTELPSTLQQQQQQQQQQGTQ
jgi:hypothetical protein